MVKRLLVPLLACFTRFCMQTRVDALKIVRLGASSERVEVSGNMKFDIPAPNFSAADVLQLRSTFGLPQTGLVWVAGSTRQGEEELLLEAFNGLRQRGHACNLVLVPRYPERAEAVCELVSAAGLQPVLRSSLQTASPVLGEDEVLIGDTLGEMLSIYACADLVFVGGSLVPVGGHNVLEASMLSKPVLFGPHTQNCKEIAGLLLEAGGGVRVTRENLLEQVEQLLNDSSQRARIGELGAAVYAEHAGAAGRTCQVLVATLQEG